VALGAPSNLPDGLLASVAACLRRTDRATYARVHAHGRRTDRSLVRVARAMTSGDQAAWSRPSVRLWRMRVTELCVLGVAFGLVAVIAATAAKATVLAVAMACCVAVVAVSLLFTRRRYRAWGYLEREEDLLVRRGVLISRLSVVPYGRMQLVEVTAGMVERLFGLSTVKLHTAAARSDARIPGLEPAEAARLRDRLAALGEAKAAGL
jgi:hypothetical protein